MNSRALLLLMLCFFLCGNEAWAGRRVRLNDLTHETVPKVQGRLATQAELDLAMKQAMEDHAWKVKDFSPGSIRAETVVRNKHIVEVQIHYDAEELSIIYVSSVNLNFKTDDKGRRIHPNYHKWIRWLADSFKTHLRSL